VYLEIFLIATATHTTFKFNKTVRDYDIMPQGGRGKARAISDAMIIDSDDNVSQAVVDDHGTKELPVDGELSDDSLPAIVSVDKVQDAQGQRGVKRKISASGTSKQIPGELKQLFRLTSESIVSHYLQKTTPSTPK
jgi:hypothetical protein